MTDTIVDSVAVAAAEAPDRPAILEKRLGRWRTRSVGELAAAAGSVAAGLAANGVGAADTVALMLEDHSESVTIDLGVMASGALSMHVPPGVTAADLTRIFEIQPPRVVVVQGQQEADRVLELHETGRLPSLEVLAYLDPAGVSEYTSPVLAPASRLRAQGRLEDFVPLEPEAPAAAIVDLVSTISVVVHSHRSLWAGTAASIETFGIGSSDRVVAVRPIADPGERTLTVYPTILAGSRLAIPESRGTVPSAIREVAPTYVHLSTRHLGEVAGALLVRFSENRRGKSLVSRWWSSRTGAKLSSYGRERRPGPLARLAVGLPALEKVGLDRVRRLAVSGLPIPPELPAFFRSLGIEVTALVTDPVVAGPLMVDGAPVVACATDASGVLTVQGAQVAAPGGEPAATRLVGSTAGRETRVLGSVGAVVSGATGPMPAMAVEELVLASPFVRSAVAVGGDTGVEVLVELARAPVARWAQQERLEAATYRSLAALPELRALLEEVVSSAASEVGIPRADLRISPMPFHETPGALTSGGTPRRRLLTASERRGPEDPPPFSSF